METDGSHGLQTPPPRPVRRRADRGSLLGCRHVVLLPHTLIGLFLLVLAVLSLTTPLGRVVRGEVTGREPAQRSRRGGSAWRLRVRCGPPADREYSFTVARDTYDRLREGQPVRVLIPPVRLGQPALLLEEPWTVPAHIAGHWGVALFWNVIVWFVGWWETAVALRNRRLLIHGRPGSGSITGKRPVSGRPTVYMLEYSFAAGDGRPYRGGMAVRQPEWEPVEVGTPVVVAYNEANPRSSMLPAFGDYEVVPR